MLFLKTHSTHFIYGYMASDIWLRTILIVRKEEREREMLFLKTHSTHFIYGYMASDHAVKDHSDSEKGNPLPPHRLLFPINSKGSFICIIPDRIAHTMAFVTPVVEHWLEREIAQRVHPMKDRSDNPLHHDRMLLPWSYISLPVNTRKHLKYSGSRTLLWYCKREGTKEMFYLTTHSTHCFFSYMASDCNSEW